MAPSPREILRIRRSPRWKWDFPRCGSRCGRGRRTERPGWRDPIRPDTEENLDEPRGWASDGAGEADGPQLDLAGFAGPLAQLLALARAQAIDLREISLAALLDQLATAFAAAGRAVPLAQQGDWLVMAAWLVWLRSRLLLPVDAPAQAAAAAEAGRLRDRLLALQAVQRLAAWLDGRPQLGHDVFARGAPEWLGTGLATAWQGDVVGLDGAVRRRRAGGRHQRRLPAAMA